MLADSVASQVLAALREHGPMMRIDICLLLGFDISDWGISSALCHLRSTKTKMGHRRRRQVYIKAWDTGDADGASRRYIRAVYAAGAFTDAEKPKARTATERGTEAKRRKRAESEAVRHIPNSVFALARMA